MTDDDENQDVQNFPPILVPFLRTPMRLIIIYEQTSTFSPSALHLYEVVNYMDQLVTENDVFQSLGYRWHPFVSRVYFGMLFYYQILRAMKAVGLLSPIQMRTLYHLEKSIPPEQLPVPGPLMMIYRAISNCETEIPSFKKICPRIPDLIGPETASLGMPASNHFFLMPKLTNTLRVCEY